MEANPNYIPLLLVLLLAFLAALIFTRLRPVAVVAGEILAGAIIGRSGF
jgi:Kef-type K+ transport system membrane component KefB